jgi:hypothetical protein
VTRGEQTSPIRWRQDDVAGVPLQRYIGHAGTVEVGFVEFDGGNRMWIWSSGLADEAWGWAPTGEGAKQALELWLRNWLENFRSLFDGSDGRGI